MCLLYFFKSNAFIFEPKFKSNSSSKPIGSVQRQFRFFVVSLETNCLIKHNEN